MTDAAAAASAFSGQEIDLPGLIDRAAQDFRSGRWAEADALYARIVALQPGYPDGWFLYGLSALEAGETGAAIERLRRAATIRRAEPRYHVALARACLAADRHEEAVSALEVAARLSPDSPDINAALGKAYLALGRTDRAAACSGKALSAAFHQFGRRQRHALARLTIAPRAAFALPARRDIPWAANVAYERARIAERNGETPLANRFYGEAASLASEWALPLVQLGRTAFDAEQFGASRGYLEAACERAPDDADTLASLGRTLSRMAFHEEACHVLERAHRLAPHSVAVRCELGWAHFRSSATRPALEHFAAVLAVEPHNIDAHLGTARCHIDLGHAATATQWLNRTLALNPGHAAAFRELANVKALEPGSPQLTALDALAGQASLPVRRRSILNMALGEVYRTHGDPARAFHHYDLGNALKDVTFDVDSWRGHLEGITQTFNTAHFARLAGAGNTSEVPVFIVGMPRSGTSLVEQILASHPAVHGAGERDDIGRLAETLGDVIGDDAAYPACVANLSVNDTDTLADEQLARLRTTAPDARRIVVKMPGNFVHLGLIATLFPKARIVHCRRDPLDVCLSIYFGEFAGDHPYAYDLRNLGLYYREYERIMAHWAAELPTGILDVCYEDVVNDVEGETRRLLDYCGLPWDPRCLAFHKTARTVHTRSNVQVRQPIYRSSCGRWRPYAQWLLPLAEALGGEQPDRLRAALDD